MGHVATRRKLLHRGDGGGTGCGYSDRLHFSGGIFDGAGLPFADCLRHRLITGQEVAKMRIVVWKAPRLLRGVLRTIFGVGA